MTDSTNPRPTPSITRRGLTKGAAWTLPAVAVASAAPAFAASISDCPTNARIDQFFAQRRTEVANYDGCAGTTSPTFTIWYDGGGGANGALQNSFINVRNQNSCTIDLRAYPLAFRIDIANSAGADVAADRPGVLRRSLTSTNSYGYLSRLSAPGVERSGIKNETYWEANGTEQVQMSDGSTATRTIYSARWNTVRAATVVSGEDIDIQFSWADGLAAGGRLNNIYRLVPLGMAAPQWADLTTADSGACADAYAYYSAKVAEWYRNGYGCNPNIRWEVATDVTATSFRTTSGYTRTPITCGTGMWSNVSRDFTPSHDGIY